MPVAYKIPQKGEDETADMSAKLLTEEPLDMIHFLDIHHYLDKKKVEKKIDFLFRDGDCRIVFLVKTAQTLESSVSRGRCIHQTLPMYNRMELRLRSPPDVCQQRNWMVDPVVSMYVPLVTVCTSVADSGACSFLHAIR